jgi:hypothetical protein
VEGINGVGVQFSIEWGFATDALCETVTENVCQKFGCSQTGTVVKSSHMGTNGCPSSIELDAQNVQPHETTIKRKRTTPKVVNLPVLLTRLVKAETAEK